VIKIIILTFFLIIFSREDFATFKISNHKVILAFIIRLILFFKKMFGRFNYYLPNLVLEMFAFCFFLIVYFFNYIGAGDIKVVLVIFVYVDGMDEYEIFHFSKFDIPFTLLFMMVIVTILTWFNFSISKIMNHKPEQEFFFPLVPFFTFSFFISIFIKIVV